MGPVTSRSCRIIAVVIVVALTGAACSGESSEDPVAFCDLLADGVGRADGDVSAAEFDRLAEVAPADIRGAVDDLRNAAVDLAEIAETATLAELFARAFDPEARDARRELDRWAVVECDLEIDLEAIQTDLATFMETNYAGADWVDLLDIELDVVEGRLEAITAELSKRLVDIEPAFEACRGLSVYLYEIQGGSGTVDVMFDGETVVSRFGRDADCRAP